LAAKQQATREAGEGGREDKGKGEENKRDRKLARKREMICLNTVFLLRFKKS